MCLYIENKCPFTRDNMHNLIVRLLENFVKEYYLHGSCFYSMIITKYADKIMREKDRKKG